MRQWWPTLAAGGSVAAFLVFWLGAVTVTGAAPSAPHGAIEYFLYRYQTMLTGLVAIAAAAIGAHAVRAQIRQAADEANNSRLRKARATRAMLPLALSSVMDYAEQCLAAMNTLRPQVAGHALPSPVPHPPQPVEWPDQALILMRDYVEHADDTAAMALTALIAKLQVQRSRFTEVIRHALGTPARATPLSLNLETYVIDAAEIYARASALFGHAREGEIAPPLSGGNVVSAMNLMGMSDFDDATIYTRVINRANW